MERETVLSFVSEVPLFFLDFGTMLMLNLSVLSRRFPSFLLGLSLLGMGVNLCFLSLRLHFLWPI